MGVKELGLSNRTHSASLLIPLRLNIQAVTVVPTFAPMMTLIACFRVMSPELTKPTTMTVVADELCMIAVMPSPVKKPVIFVLVIFDSRLLSFPPALFSRACPITLMPNMLADCERITGAATIRTKQNTESHTTVPMMLKRR